MTDSLSMTSLSDGYRALLIGASGVLGTAFCDWLSGHVFAYNGECLPW